MTIRRPLYMQAAEGDTEITYSAQDYRLLVASLLSEGVIGPGDLAVTQRAAGATFSVDIAPGTVVIAGDSVDEQGSYLCRSTGVENRAIPEPPGSGSRTHRVVARLYDHLHDGSTADYEWELEVLPDVGLGTPDTPPSAVSLALVTVAVGQTDVDDGDIVNTRPTAVAGGGIPKVYCIKSGDTARTGTASLAADPHLKANLVAGHQYEVRGTLIISAGAGDLVIDMRGPTGFGCDLTAHGIAVSATTGTAGDLEAKLLTATPTATSFGGTGVANKLTVHLHGHLYSGSGGEVSLFWAQGGPSGDATTLHANSLVIFDPFN